jgi:hypothetical protein
MSAEPTWRPTPRNADGSPKRSRWAPLGTRGGAREYLTPAERAERRQRQQRRRTGAQLRGVGEFVSRVGPLVATMVRLAGGDAGAIVGLAGRLALDGFWRATTNRSRRSGKAKNRDTVAAVALAGVGVGLFAAVSTFGLPLTLLGAVPTYFVGSVVRNQARGRTRDRSQGPVRVRTHERTLPGGGTVKVQYHGRSKATR